MARTINAIPEMKSPVILIFVKVNNYRSCNVYNGDTISIIKGSLVPHLFNVARRKGREPGIRYHVINEERWHIRACSEFVVFSHARLATQSDHLFAALLPLHACPEYRPRLISPFNHPLSGDVYHVTSDTRPSPFSA